MTVKTTSSNKKSWKNYDYKKAARILKNSDLLKIDFRKKEPLSKYQKQKIRDLIKVDDGAIFRMAKFRQEGKNRRRLEKLAGIPQGFKLTPDYVQKKVGDALLHGKMDLNKKEISELNNLYNQHRKTIINNPNNYGLRNFTRKKVTKSQGKLMVKSGWTVKNGHVYLPTNVNYTKGYKTGLYYYTFPNGSKVPALVHHNKKRIGVKEYSYLLMSTSREILEILNNLEASGIDRLDNDLIYTSPTKARLNDSASKTDSIGWFLNYISNSATDAATDKKTKAVDKPLKAELESDLIESMRVDSDTKPTEKVL